MINLPYILFRLLRRSLPSPIAYRLLSNDVRAPKRFMRTGLQYLELLQAHGVGITDRVILETGPGTYSPAGLGLLNFGAGKIILQEPYLRRINWARLKELIQSYWKTLEPRVSIRRPVEELFIGNRYNPERVVLQTAHAEATGLPSESVDIILSCSVLEHVKEVAATLREEYRILKTGGSILHLVDLQDHFFRYPFEMLTFSKFVWERILTTPKGGGGFQNRLRADDYCRLLEEIGFKEIRYTALSQDLEGLLKIKPRLHPDFKARDDTAMSATQISLYAVK